MKYTYSLLLLLLLAVPMQPAAGSSPDTLPPIERLAQRARLFGERIPQEKVYVHMDNTGYFLGDTIWFAAYTRRTDTGRPSKVSRVLYAELWDNDGVLVERKLVEMKDGRGSGFFALPDTLYSGFFELRAYTRWQLNWGRTEHPHDRLTENYFYSKDMAREFFQDYEKLYSRVFPVYDRPREEGTFTRDMTMRPLRRYFRKDAPQPKLLLSLFPEGGSLVAGVPCRVAFEAATEEGEAVEGRLVLKMENGKWKMENGEWETEVRTEHRGRGSFTFTPERGRTYRFLFTADDGRTAEARLKADDTGGVALRVEQRDSIWNFTISPNGESLGLTVMHEGVTSHFFPLTDSRDIAIPETELPAGVNQATVFDREGRMLADRLFFVTKPQLYQATVQVQGLKEEYEPYEQIDFTLNLNSPSLGRGQGEVSLAVRDAALSDPTFDSGNIMTEMLLASEIRGFVPQPEWFFEKDDEEHRRGLDLLMMTQGWRRFRWSDMAVEGTWDITQPAERTQILNGSVNNYSLGKHQTTGELESDGYLGHVRTTFPEVYLNIPKDMPTEDFSFPGFNGLKTSGELVGDIMKEPVGSIMRAPVVVSNVNNHYAEAQDRMKRDVRVHAEFLQPGVPDGIVSGDATTAKGQFRLEAPHFYGDCIFFLTAKDTTLWDKKMRKLWLKKYRQHNWVQPGDDENTRIHEDAEFYVRLNWPYPRWAKPYSFYQTHLAELQEQGRREGAETDSQHALDEVTVRAKRNGRRRIDLSKPAYVIDAYEAGNEIMDAGLVTTLHKPMDDFLLHRRIKIGDIVIEDSFALGAEYQNMDEVARMAIINYVGDMNMGRKPQTSLYWDSTLVVGSNVLPTSYVDHDIQKQYSRLEYIDKLYLYTDYSPRQEGSKRYEQSDQPSVEVSLHKLPSNTKRLTYRDRRYILHGFALQADFYHPDYKRNPPKPGQKDCRRTLYWNPELRLDGEGKAKISLFNNDRRTHIAVEVAGQARDGTPLWH